MVELADAQEIPHMVKDVDGHNAAVDAIVTAVPELEAIVKKGRAELAQIELDKMERNSLQAELDAMQQTLAEKQNAIQKMVDVACWRSHAYVVEKLLQDTVSLKGVAQDAEIVDWRADIQEVSEHMKFVVHAIDTELMQAKKAHQEEFTRRLQAFNQGADAKQSKGGHCKPESFLQDEGLSDHKEPLSELLKIIFCLREARAPRSAVQRCLNQWVKSVWSGEYDASVCMSLRPNDKPTTTRMEMAGATATHSELQRTEHMIVARQHHRQSVAETASNQVRASKQPQKVYSNDGHVDNRAATLHVAMSLPIRQTTPLPPRQTMPWQSGVGPALRTVGCNTDGATPTAAPEPSDAPRGITPLPSGSLLQALESRPPQAHVRLDRCVCLFAFLLIGFASGWMSSTLRMNDAPRWNTASGPPKKGRMVGEVFGQFLKGRGMRKSKAVSPHSKWRRS